MILERFCYSDMGTFGKLYMDGKPASHVLRTVERPWLDNQQDISCIPEGTYICKRVQSPKFGDTFEITAVPDRTHILFHGANIYADVQGCVGLGMALGTLGGYWSVTAGQDAFKLFRAVLQGVEQFELVIMQYKP